MAQIRKYNVFLTEDEFHKVKKIIPDIEYQVIKNITKHRANPYQQKYYQEHRKERLAYFKKWTKRKKEEELKLIKQKNKAKREKQK